MNNDSGKSVSLWVTTEDVPPFEPLDHDTSTDVCIIGAGIAGLTTAYLLINEGKSVTIIEDGPLLGGETARTTAHLASALDDRFHFLEKAHGFQGVKLALESHNAAINKIEEIIHKESIDCDFSRLDGYLFSPKTSPINLSEELEAAKRAGFTDAEIVNSAPVMTFDTGECIKFPNQGQFHVLKYLKGLVINIALKGGKIFTFTKAVSLEGGENAHVITEKGFSIKARHIVVATNSPINDQITIHTKQAPYRTYAIGALIPKGSFPKILLWDTEDPYHYIRIQENYSQIDGSEYDVLIVGGEDHKTGQESNPEAHFERLISWTRERFPMAKEIEFKWSGQVLEPIDGLAFLGRQKQNNLYIITGDSGHGMTHATIGAMLINDLVHDRPNAWEELYKPGRISTSAFKEFLHENLNVAAQYLDWIKGGEVDKVEDIPLGSGAVVRKGLKKLAVYKEESGNVFTCSAVCPHLGGIVRWNDVEKSWDCPCHGSRFDAYGKVLNGPSKSDLELAAAIKADVH